MRSHHTLSSSLRRGLACSAVLVAASCAAPAADAKTFCVSKPACVGTPAPDVNAAADAANKNAGPDRIEIGEGEFANAAMGIADWGGPVEVVGSGRGKTILRNEKSAAITLSANDASVSDLTVRSSETSAVAIDLGGAGTRAERVEVVGPSAATAASDYGIILRRGGTVRDAIVTMPLHSQYANYGISVSQSNPLDAGAVPTVIENVRVEAGYAIQGRPSNRPLTVRQAALRGGIFGLHFDTPIPQVTVEQVAASAFHDGGQFSTANALGVYGFDVASAPTVIDLRHVSLSSAATKGRALSILNQGLAPITVNATDSVFLGGRDDQPGSLDLELGGFKTGQQVHLARSAWRSRNVWVPGVKDGIDVSRLHDHGGNVDLSSNTGQAVADVAAGDLRPVAGSVLIDNGTPTPLGDVLDTFDVTGAARVVDGDNDGMAHRDIGAHEAPAGTSGGHVTPSTLTPPCKQGCVEPSQPITRIAKLFRGKRKLDQRTISGTAHPSVTAVTLSITRKVKGRCEALSAKQKWVKTTKLPGGKCGHQYVLAAKTPPQWTFTLARALPKGSYEISSRGQNAVGLEKAPQIVGLKRK